VQLASLPPGQFALVKQIAADTGVPEHYLAKILQDLARNGFLRSNKGPRGGFRLAIAPAEISMLKVAEAVDGAGRYQRCLAGNDECHDRVLCSAHDSWMPVRSHIVEWLTGTSIADLAKSLGEKRQLLARPRRSGNRRN
jgi:Rrf2 family protein